MDMDAKKNKVDILSLCAEFIIEKRYSKVR